MKAEWRWYELPLPGISRFLPSFIFYTGQEKFKEKKKIIYTYEMNTAIIYDNSQRVHPASTPSEYTY